MKTKNLISRINPRTFIQDYLIANGIPENEIEDYLNPVNIRYQSPWDYPNMKLACEMVKGVIGDKGKIGILVDCDVDGLSSASIATQLLKSQSINPFIFHHTGKRHGLSVDVIDQIEQAELNLLIVPDAGSNDATACQHLAKSGTKILILDHHEITISNSCAVIINPHVDESKLNINLSGAGVTAKFVDAYCEINNLPYIYSKDLVATSIISDVCNIKDLENRKYVAEGLSRIENPFLNFLFEKAKETTPKAVGWSIAPKINALYRTATDPEIVFKAFIGEADFEEAYSYATKAYNASRKTMNEIKDVEIEESKNCAVSFIDSENASFTGLLASRVQEQTKKPALVLREADESHYSGSMRSPIAFASVLNSSHLCKADGHEKASGVFIEKDNLPKLIEWLDTQPLDLEPCREIAGELSARNINLFLCEQVENSKSLWANQLVEPLFGTVLKVKNSDISLFKKTSTTFKVEKNGVSFIKFKVNNDEVNLIESTKRLRIEILFTLGVNRYMNTETPQAMIQEWKIVEDNMEDDF